MPVVVRLLVCCVVGAALALAAAAPSEAASIKFSAAAGGCINATNVVGSTSVSGAASQTCFDSGSQTTESIASQGQASLTSLKLLLDFSVTTGATGVGSAPNANAFLSVIDTFTVFGGTGNGTLVFSWAVDGASSAAGVTSGAGLFYRSAISDPLTVVGTWFATGTQSVNQTLTLSVPIVFGTPMTPEVFFSAIVVPGAISPFSTESGHVDFFNTIALQPFVVLDNSGNRLGSASVVSSSGFQYRTAAPVPEPGTMALLGIGLAGVIALRRGRH